MNFQVKVVEGKNAGCDTVGVLSGSDSLSMLRKENPLYVKNILSKFLF